MSARTAVIGSLLLGCSLVLAADDEIPDGEFLEYLGLWEESDEDWLLFDAPITADAEKRSDSAKRNDPAPEGEESAENEDES